jgi:hypothetical protein
LGKTYRQSIFVFFEPSDLEQSIGSKHPAGRFVITKSIKIAEAQKSSLETMGEFGLSAL